MPILKWSDHYSVRVPEIDAQHKRLFEMTNAMFEAMKQSNGREQVLGNVLRELVAYAKTHLAYEEKRMAEVKFLGLPAHAREHQKLLEQVGGFVTQYNAGNRNILVQLTQFLQKWLVEHVSKSDMLYADALAGSPS